MLIDTHCHLNDPAYQGDSAGVIERARQAGVEGLVTIGTDLKGSQEAVAIAEKHPNVYAVVGFHPNEADKVNEGWWEPLEALARHPKVKAIGETGLDYYRDHASRDNQERVFRRLIHLARTLSLPLVIHTREAVEDTLRMLWEEKAQEVGGVFHCFGGDQRIFQEGRELDFYFSVGGVMTYPKANELREAVKNISHDRLMMETDAPYLAPQSRRGGTNEPAWMVESARKTAEVLGITIEEFEAHTTANAKRLFQLPE